MAKCISERTGERVTRVALYGGSRYHAERSGGADAALVKVEWNRVYRTSSLDGVRFFSRKQSEHAGKLRELAHVQLHSHANAPATEWRSHEVRAGAKRSLRRIFECRIRRHK